MTTENAYNYAELFRKWATLFGLKHTVTWSQSAFGPALEVKAIVVTPMFESVMDVCETGKIVHVDQLRRYKQGATDTDVEKLSRQILESTFAEGRYIESFKGGYWRERPDGSIERFPQITITDLPRSVDELLIRLDLKTYNI